MQHDVGLGGEPVNQVFAFPAVRPDDRPFVGVQAQEQAAACGIVGVARTVRAAATGRVTVGRFQLDDVRTQVTEQLSRPGGGDPPAGFQHANALQSTHAAGA